MLRNDEHAAGTLTRGFVVRRRLRGSFPGSTLPPEWLAEDAFPLLNLLDWTEGNARGEGLCWELHHLGFRVHPKPLVSSCEADVWLCPVSDAGLINVDDC